MTFKFVFAAVFLHTCRIAAVAVLSVMVVGVSSVQIQTFEAFVT